MTEAAKPKDLPPLQGVPLVLGTIFLALATFLNVLDMTITNVSIPAISGDLGASPSQGAWVITSYTAANAFTVLLSGWLAQRVGQVRLIVISVLLFSASSLCCALSPNLGTLIFFRVVQGLVCGPMITMGQPLLLQSYPVHKIGTALAAWTSTLMVAPVLGPLVGGYLTDNYSWHWIFYINVPLGIVTAWGIWQIYRERESPVQRRPIDFVGVLLAVVWVGCLQIVADKGRELDWFNSTLIVTLTVVAVITLAFFLVWEWTDKHPVVDLRVFRYRNFTVACLLMAMSFSLFMGANVLFPLWLQQYMGYTALAAGMMLAPTSLLSLVLMPMAGRISGRIDVRRMVSVGFVIIAASYVMRSGMTSNADFMAILVPNLVMGCGLPLYFIGLTVIVFDGLPADKMASASALMNFMRYFFAALWTSGVLTIWDRRTVLHHSELAESINQARQPATDALRQISGSGLDATQALALIDHQVTLESAVIGANEIFFLSSFLLLSVAGLIWLSRPVKRTGAIPVDAGH